jgi:hypothetical protein
MICGAHICRSAGYWSTHSGYGRGTGVNVSQQLLDAVGGIDVCGMHVDETSNVNAPYLEGLGLDSVLEGLCVSVEGESMRQLYRQLIAAALNCEISGSDCDEAVQTYVDVSFSECDDLCADGSEDGAAIQQCITELGCFNNGGQVIDGKCALGRCEVDESSLCGSEYGKCPGSGQACIPFPGNCHSAILCNEELGVCPKKASASSSNACREAKGNGCTVTDCP